MVDELCIAPKAGYAFVTPTPTMSWREAPAFRALGGGFATFVNGRRNASGLFELWGGTAAIRTLPDLRVAGTGQERAAAAGGALTITTTGNDTAAGSGANAVSVDYIQAGTGYERFGIAPTGGTQAVLQAQVIDGVPTIIGGPVTDAIRVNGARVLQAGGANVNAPGAANANTITVAIATVQQHAIAPLQNRAHGAFWMVPRGFTGRLTGLGLSAAESAGLDLRLAAQLWSIDKDSGLVTARTGLDVFFDVVFPRGTILSGLEAPKRLPPLTEFSIRVNNPGGAQTAAANLSLYLLKDDEDPDPNPELQPLRLDGGGR